MGISLQLRSSKYKEINHIYKKKKKIIGTKMYSLKVVCLALVLATACARPQDFEYDTDSDGNFDAEVIQELAARDLYDLSPKYAFTYQVADEEHQTYIKQTESRDADLVTGEYSYVDPLGSLITVKYTAGPDGYQETRTSEPNFVAIRNAPVIEKPEVVPPKPAPVRPKPFVKPAPAKEESNEDLIAKIIAQLTPFIKSTVSNSLGGQR